MTKGWSNKHKSKPKAYIIPQIGKYSEGDYEKSRKVLWYTYTLLSGPTCDQWDHPHLCGDIGPSGLGACEWSATA